MTGIIMRPRKKRRNIREGLSKSVTDAGDAQVERRAVTVVAVVFGLTCT